MTVNHSSPFAPTPAYSRVGSSNTQIGSSLGNANSPNDAPTPNMLALRKIELNDSSRLLVQAKNEDLSRHLERSERKYVRRAFLIDQ